MNRDDIQKLLGGYATGTLTPEEQEALFCAALDDQELFDALAREQALRDLLRDPAAKAELLAALDQRPVRWYQRILPSWRPLAAVAAMAGVSALAVVVWQAGKTPKPILTARATLPQPQPLIPESVRPSEEDKRAEAPSAATPPPSGKPTSVAPASKDEAPSAPALAGRSDKAKLDTNANSVPTAAPVALAKKEEAPALAAPPIPRPGMVRGFREAIPPAPQFVPPAGGVIGGIAGAQPANAPAAPPPPRPAQAATSGPAAQTQQQPTVSQTQEVRVQEEKALADAAVPADAQQLFYGRDAQQARGGGGGASAGPSGGKRTAVPYTAPAAGVANSVAITGGVLQAMFPANFGVRYTLLRKNQAGVFEPVRPENLQTGDTIEVQIESNVSGSLTVHSRSGGGTWHEAASHNLIAHQPFITKPLRAGETEMEIRLAPTRAALTSTSYRDASAPADLKRKSTDEPATYVVAPAGARRIEFTIPLNYK